MNTALQLGALSLLAAVMSAFLKSHRPELVLPLQIGAGVLLLAAVLPAAKDGWLQLRESFSLLDVPLQLLSAVWKGAAVCVVTRLCASFCKDSGNEALASALLFAGRVGILLPALPLLRQAAEIAAGFAG